MSIRDNGIRLYDLTERAARVVLVDDHRPSIDGLVKALNRLRAAVADYPEGAENSACCEVEDVDLAISRENSSGSPWRGEATVDLLREIAKNILHDPYEGEGCLTEARELANVLIGHKMRPANIHWDISGWHGIDLDVASCTHPGCGWVAELAGSGFDDIDEFTRWACAHGDAHGESHAAA
jgi:hypothetical protein